MKDEEVRTGKEVRDREKGVGDSKWKIEEQSALAVALNAAPRTRGLRPCGRHHWQVGSGSFLEARRTVHHMVLAFVSTL